MQCLNTGGHNRRLLRTRLEHSCGAFTTLCPQTLTRLNGRSRPGCRRVLLAHPTDFLMFRPGVPTSRALRSKTRGCEPRNHPRLTNLLCVMATLARRTLSSPRTDSRPVSATSATWGLPTDGPILPWPHGAQSGTTTPDGSKLSSTDKALKQTLNESTSTDSCGILASNRVLLRSYVSRVSNLGDSAH